MTVLSNLSSSLWRGIQCDAILLSSGSLPTRQVQMFDVAIPLVVELVLSASYILPPSSSPASFVLVFLFIFFLAFSFRLPFLSVILLLECVRSTAFVWFYCAYEGSFLSNRFQYFFICLMFCPADFLHSSPSPHFKSLKSFYIFFLHVSSPYSTTLHISVFIIRIFNVLFTFPLKSSLLFENASFSIAILLIISLWHLSHL